MGQTPSTGGIYARYVKRRFKLANVTPEEVVERSEKDIQTYIDMKNLANNFTERGRPRVQGKKKRGSRAVTGL